MWKNTYVFLLAVCMGSALEFQFQNNLPSEVWVGCQGNSGHESLDGGGWKLAPGQKMSVNSADDWAGRFWARTWCNDATNHCLTGDCGNKLQCNGAGGAPPASLAEITLKAADGLDYYDISLVDGFNVEISIEPLGGQGDGSQYSCKKAACLYPILPVCPSELQLIGDAGQVIGCNSACKLETCMSTDYSKFFKDSCPDAYSYAYDDKSTFTCNAPAYLITFGA